ncbi:hypothetical protein [Ascidiimonas sp. W6]|uniref:hypothetical protein n=1 Tax=Ascidiimonas meishanensis TaxID=3128903 RepID=UPI0030ECFD68
MDILDKIGLKDADFLKKLNLDQITSGEKLSDPTALKEIITYELPPLIILESDSTDLKLRSSANLSHTTQLFNEPGDKDKDGILGNDKKAALKLNTNYPILKHALSFGVTAGASGNVKGVDFGIETGAALKTIAYFKHGKEDKVRDALLSDLKGMSFGYFLPQVKKLKVGEALAVVTNANIGLSLAFETTDVISAGLDGLTDFIKSSESIALDIDLGAKIGVNFSLTGNYELIFTKVSGTRYGLFVKSAVASETKANAKLGASAAFNNPKAVSDFLEKQLDKLLEAVTTLDIEEITDLEKKLKDASAANLSLVDLEENEQKVVTLLIDRLKLKDEVDKVTGLLNKIGEIRGDIKTKIAEAAKTKIEAGFNYEYSRMSSTDILLKAEMDESILTKTHKDLVLFNTTSFVDLATKATNKNKISVKEYLKEKSLKITRNWGISLGIGNYKFGGSDTKEIESKIQETIIDNVKVEKVAFDGIRKYEETGDLGGFGNDYWVAFNASMDEFKKEPTVSDFDYGFSFFLEHREGKLRRSEKDKFLQIMDMAKLWNIVSEKEGDNRTDELWSILNHKTKSEDISFSFKLNFTAEAFDSLKADWTNLIVNQPDKNLRLISQAFGKAMPYDADFKYRKDSQLRGQAYGELWNYYFRNEGLTGIPNEVGFAHYSQKAEDYFKTREFDLSRLEGKYDNPNQAGDNKWFGGIIRINNPAKNIKSFLNGLEDLLFAIQTKDPKYEKVVKRAFRDMQSGWAFQFCIKALGIYFLEMAKIKGITKAVESQLEIKYTDKDGNEKAILLKKKD